MKRTPTTPFRSQASREIADVLRRVPCGARSIAAVKLMRQYERAARLVISNSRHSMADGIIEGLRQELLSRLLTIVEGGAA